MEKQACERIFHLPHPMRTKFLSLLSVASLLASASPAFAAAPRADLQVQLVAPSSVQISTATTYTATVKNLGPATTDVGLVIEFPLTNTSPTVSILGTVSESEANCSIGSNKITCLLGSLKNNKTVSVSYSYTAPVSTKTLQMKATVSSSVTDDSAGNNIATVVPNLIYPARAITSANVQNSHCTGTNLTSYFECLLYPSSISSHPTTLNSNGSITFSEPGYTGTWTQNAAKTTLSFEYFDFSGKIAGFEGRAINGANCFDGMTNFFPASAYVSPYRVCILP